MKLLGYKTPNEVWDEEINDTPMKLLGYKTPNEVWDEEMAKLQSKQADPKPAVALTS